MPGTVGRCVNPGGLGYMYLYIIVVPHKKSIIVVGQQKYSCTPKIKSSVSLRSIISFSPFTVRGRKLMINPLIRHRSNKTISMTPAVRRPAWGMTAFERPARGATVLA
jgi:hypothetical protein